MINFKNLERLSLRGYCLCRGTLEMLFVQLPTIPPATLQRETFYSTLQKKFKELVDVCNP